MPKPNDSMSPRTRPVDNETLGILGQRLVVVARDVPHHDLVTFVDLLAAELGILQRAVRRIWTIGVCQRITSGTKLSIKTWLSRSLRCWSGLRLSARTGPVMV